MKQSRILTLAANNMWLWFWLQWTDTHICSHASSSILIPCNHSWDLWNWSARQACKIRIYCSAINLVSTSLVHASLFSSCLLWVATSRTLYRSSQAYRKRPHCCCIRCASDGFLLFVVLIFLTEVVCACWLGWRSCDLICVFDRLFYTWLCAFVLSWAIIKNQTLEDGIGQIILEEPCSDSVD